MSAGAAPYDGLFPPDSVTWRVHAEPALWVGGVRALLLQALHPAALSGVLVHSDFRLDPWGRLLRTAAYVGTVTYGTRAEVEEAAARVRDLHHRVAGVDAVSGDHYRADDPQLLAWVHCCEVDSFLCVARRSRHGLTPEEADRYVAEQVTAAGVLGCDPGLLPTSTGGLDTYFRVMRRRLRGDGRTRQIARYVLWPPMPRHVELLTPARPAWVAGVALAFTLLPPWARRLYGVPVLPGADTAGGLVLRGLGTVTARLPQRLREGPHLRAAKERLAA